MEIFLLEVTYPESRRVSQPRKNIIQNGQLEVFTFQSKIERARIYADPRSSTSLLDNEHLIDPVSGFVNFDYYIGFIWPVRLHLHSSTD